MEIFFIIAIIPFGIRTIAFIGGWISEQIGNRKFKPGTYMPFVSVIVPARNEEANIAASIKALSESDYPPDKFEIIAVNDRSTDNTRKILECLAGSASNLKVLNIEEASSQRNLRGKPGALQNGINFAKGEIILMTDADCGVNKNWIKTMTAPYADNRVGLVAGYTVAEGAKIFDKIQAVEWVCMNSIGSAGMAIGHPLGCYGNNLSVRKSDFDELGGYRGIPFSVTEDLALLRQIHKKGKKVRYICNSDTLVETIPIDTFRDYLHQHHRWAIGATCLGWRAAAFVGASVFLWLGILLSIISGDFLWTISYFGLRFFADIFLTLPALMIIKRANLIKWLAPSAIFFILLELVIPVTLIRRDVKWKGQVFK